jgi:MOSC domain-containing protein YiiM
MASVRYLFRAPKKSLPMEELAEANLIADLGVEGCAHSRPSSKRQVLLLDSETLQAMELAPGIVRENITTEGLAIGSLKEGQRLRIGEAVLQVTASCTPCDQLEKIRPGLRREMWGRRGMLCRVLTGGLVRCGDTIEKLA